MKEIDWANLSFGYMKTDYNVRINFRNGAWGELEISSSEVLNLHMAALWSGSLRGFESLPW